MNGEWRLGPGRALFDALSAALPNGVPILAEDLGVITTDVVALRCASLFLLCVLLWWCCFEGLLACPLHSTLPSSYTQTTHPKKQNKTQPPKKHYTHTARRSARPAWSCCSSRGAAAPPTCTCRTCTTPTASAIRARTTTRRPSAGAVFVSCVGSAVLCFVSLLRCTHRRLTLTHQQPTTKQTTTKTLN